MKKWLKTWRPTEIIIAASTAGLLVLFLVLGIWDASGANATAWFSYYAHLFAGSFAGFFYSSIIFLCLVLIALVIWALGRGFLGIIFPSLRPSPRDGKNKNADPKEIFLNAMRRSRDVLLIIPAILFIAFAGLAMGEANMFDRARLIDPIVAALEHGIFGNYVFAALGSFYYPHWLINFIIFSFDNMSTILIVSALLVTYLAPKKFRELLVAFCIGILAMIPLWLLVPVLSPQDRYINNVYNLPMSPQLTLAVAHYHPQPEIANFLQNVRTDKEGLPALPTSTMPSAHIFWAVIAGYYLFRTRRWLGWIALPFLLASSFGTVLLAQHYFLDVPVGIAIAALAIWLAHDIETEKII